MSERYDIGFLGGGQLARMSIQAAQRMGLRCLSLDPEKNSPAGQIADSIEGRLDDPISIAKVLKSCDRVTLENEFIPADSIRRALGISEVSENVLCPSVETLAVIQDKLTQRQALLKAGVPCPNAVAIEGDGSSAIDTIGFPMALKARFGGYDGKGNRYARSPNEFRALTEVWEKGGWLAESFVPFKRELAAMVFLTNAGAGAFPTMETVQTNSVCDLVFPAGIDASRTAIAAVEAVGGYGGFAVSSAGLFGVEMFELENGEILINELAPRPHNTGHYTLDWGGVSQFEQHVRIVMGLPTIEPTGADTCMANILGQGDEDDFRAGIWAALDLDSDIRVHWYGKAKSRKGRKMGHLNAVGADCLARARAARERFYSAVTR